MVRRHSKHKPRGIWIIQSLPYFASKVQLWMFPFVVVCKCLRCAVFLRGTFFSLNRWAFSINNIISPQEQSVCSRARWMHGTDILLCSRFPAEEALINHFSAISSFAWPLRQAIPPHSCAQSFRFIFPPLGALLKSLQITFKIVGFLSLFICRNYWKMAGLLCPRNDDRASPWLRHEWILLNAAIKQGAEGSAGPAFSRYIRTVVYRNP